MCFRFFLLELKKKKKNIIDTMRMANNFCFLFQSSIICKEQKWNIFFLTILSRKPFIIIIIWVKIWVDLPTLRDVTCVLISLESLSIINNSWEPYEIL